MFLRVLLLMLAIMPISFDLQAGVWTTIKETFTGPSKQPPTEIRVLLLHDVEKADLEVRGRYSLFDPFTNNYISTRFTGKRRQLQTLSDGLKWGEAFPGLYQIRIRPDEPQTVTSINQSEYSGNIFIYDVGGSISVVNQVPVEDYVLAILANYETQVSGLHPEVINALAIVARTNAYYQSYTPKTSYWAVDAQKVGYKGNPPLNEMARSIQDALHVTRYMIMSNTGVYEGVATPFPAEFGFITPGHTYEGVVQSRISLEEANQMAQEGSHAAQILAKAFANTTISLSP